MSDNTMVLTNTVSDPGRDPMEEVEATITLTRAEWALVVTRARMRIGSSRSMDAAKRISDRIKSQLPDGTVATREELRIPFRRTAR